MFYPDKLRNNKKPSKTIIANKKAQIRNQTLFQYEASSHKKLEGSPEKGTVFLSGGLGVNELALGTVAIRRCAPIDLQHHSN